MTYLLNRLIQRCPLFRLPIKQKPMEETSKEGMPMSRLPSQSVFVRTLFIVVGLLVSVVVQAGTFTDVSASLTAPATSSTGNFTVTFKTEAHGTHYLQQKKDSNSWTDVASYVTDQADYTTVISRSVSRSGLVAATYSYRVKYVPSTAAEPTLGTSPLYSNTKTVFVAIIPGVPSSITASAVSGNVGAYTVSWGAASGTVTSYQLQQKKDSGSWNQIYSGTSQSQSISGLADGTYSYRVRACNSDGCSAYKTDTNASFVITTPSSASTSSIQSISTSHQVSWGASTGTVDNYQLYRKINDTNWIRVYEGTGLSNTFNDLVDGHYQYWVRACNTESSYTVCSDYQSTVRLTLSMVSTPINFTVPTGDTDGAYTITWQPGVGTATTYTLQEQVNGGAWATVQDTADTSYIASGKTNNLYSYKVRGCNLGGCTDYTAAQTVEVNIIGQPGPISGPDNLQEADDFTLVWGSASGTVTHYELEEQASGGSWSQIYSGTDLAQAFTDHNYGTYNYRE